MWSKVKLILKNIKEYKKYAILTPLCMVVEAAVECIIPFIVSLLIDDLTNGKIVTVGQAIWPYGVTLLILVILSLGGGWLGGIFAAKASVGLSKNLREDVYKQLQTFSFANIDKFSTSSLITRMTTDISNIQMAFQMCIRIVIRAPLMFIFATVMSIIKGGLVSLIFVVIIPIIVVSFLLLFKKVMPIFKRMFKKYDAVNQSIEENVSGIRVVKTYVREDYEKAKFKKASEDIKSEGVRAEKILVLNNPIMNTSIHIANITLCTLVAFAIVRDPKGPISLGTLTSLMTYGVQILMSLLMITMVLAMLAMSIESINRIGEVLLEESTIRNPEDPITEVKDGAVSFKNVNFKYSETADRYALENIDFTIKSGEFIGIIGSTGSGKTSLVNLISRLYDVTEGEVEVGGINVKNYDLKVLRDNVAVVLQKNLLFSGTINDNIRWGDLDATEEEIKKVCKIAQAAEFIETFPDKYNTHIEQGGNNVSGGQKQRLCIARALLKKPKILILDDSTSAVDTKTDALIRKGLAEQIPDTTKIIIAQRISSIENADKIIVMNNGTIDAIGNHKTLLKTNAIYKEVYESQNKKGGK